MVIQTRTPKATIEIGDDVGITGGTLCAAQSIVIGAGTMLGANVTIVDTDFHPIHSKKRRYEPAPAPAERDRVIIGQNVFIGTGSIILKGVTIGANCVIGAGSVVTSDVPESHIAAGNPAKIVGQLR